MPCHLARWLLPIDRPPLDRGWIQTEAGRIVRIGRGTPPEPADDLGDVAVMPGLVNAHTHLELSWMAGRVPASPSMDSWIRTLIALRRTQSPGLDEEVAAARAAAASMRASGTVLVGDISNSLTTVGVMRDAGLGGVVFHEILGFSVRDAAAVVAEAWARVARATEELERGGPLTEPIDLAVAAHAPYSVAPALFREIVRRRSSVPLTVHLGESPEEIEFLRFGSGPIRATLEALGVWTGEWAIPAVDPVRYVDDLGYLLPGTLAVHGVHLSDAGLLRLRESGAILVTCPRSNEWVGAGAPPVTRFYASGVPVAIGTDSLASAPSLDLFDELAALRKLAPEVSAASLLESATRVGAHALGCGREYGTLAPGRRAALLSIDVPADVTDVEEYLVSSGRKHVRWIDT